GSILWKRHARSHRAPPQILPTKRSCPTHSSADTLAPSPRRNGGRGEGKTGTFRVCGASSRRSVGFYCSNRNALAGHCGTSEDSLCAAAAARSAAACLPISVTYLGLTDPMTLRL